jgi:hypothetical protein
MFHSDCRDRASYMTCWYDKDSLDEKGMTCRVELPVEAGDRPCYGDQEKQEQGVHLAPTRCVGADCGNCTESVEVYIVWEVCTVCDGRGSHVNPGIDADGITGSEMAELGPEFQRSYMRGDYDVPCYGCGGRRVEPVPSPDDPNCARVRKRIGMRAEWAAEEAWEARMGY